MLYSEGLSYFFSLNVVIISDLNQTILDRIHNTLRSFIKFVHVYFINVIYHKKAEKSKSCS